MKENTLKSLNESISNSDRIKNIILSNIQTEDKKVIRLNLVYLTYDFLSKTVLLEYYVEDDEYPNVEISFGELTNLLKI
ncbi:hypothetical protein F6Q07_22915 [Pectobacterium parmentieri]|uniref:Uncharacterized protein n=1 Tax=Pectobacterium parmentieri TaxID=1905730 RepID=A0A0H3HYP1_PECPM|nr:hypothetical protein [Pectobacterium parmentieri]ACX86208.1 conserved hypothetical protein [Pectobacterium parmentieri WPP163]AFI88494.1 Hypothetical protein W5S_0367 [Pectobacterium parmentieri]AYG99814.1 hypothetical protein C5E26_01890 [Pectobacterium parmentieri]AYH26052.1 hypothetical protein C5E20_02095 [Pectobacterium parmentieri]AYH30506.1 hypothetical protein C5E19_01885 [Pectobacterium parmentieri]